MSPASSRSPRGDHTCLLVDSSEAFQAAARAFLSAGAARGERLLYTADRSQAELIAEIAPLGDVDELIDRGTLRVLPTSEVYAHGSEFDPDAQVARYRQTLQGALDDGFSGLCVAAEATGLVADKAVRRRFLAYELAVDQLIANAPMTALCAYDVGAIGRGATELCAVHPKHAAPHHLEPGFRLCFGPRGLALSGEIDLANHDIFTAALESAAACGAADIVIDATNLEFIDVRGLVTLARARDELIAENRELRITNTSLLTRRCGHLLDIDPILFSAPGTAA